MDTLYDIVGYEGLYKINKNGEVWSCKRNIFLKAFMTTSGYLHYTLCVKFNMKQYSIHRLLGTHFIPNPDNLPEIDHIDQNKLNNKLENLRWISRSNNERNKKVRKTNKTGYKHISPNKTGWSIFIGTYNKGFSKKKYTLEEVVAIRNQKYIEFGIEIHD